MLACTCKSKGHAADGEQICINLAVSILFIGTTSTTQCGNDQPKWLESGELIYSQRHSHQSFGFRGREMGKTAIPEDGEEEASPIQGKDSKVLK